MQTAEDSAQVPGGQEGSLGRVRGKAAGDLKGIWDGIENTLHLINSLKCQSKEGTQEAIWFRGFLDGPGSHRGSVVGYR